MVKLFEWMRIALLSTGFGVAYYFLGVQQPLLALDWVLGWVVIPLCGLTAIQSLFFSTTAARALQREVGSGYQKQSGLNNLATTLVAVFVLSAGWSVQAKLTVLFVCLTFFVLSAIYHGIEWFRSGHSIRLHLSRLIMTPILVAACIPVVVRVSVF